MKWPATVYHQIVNKPTCLLFVAAILSFCSLKGFAGEPADVGKVMDIHGVWLLDGRPLKLFQSIPGGSKIYRSPEDQKKYPTLGKILILLRDRTSIFRSFEAPGENHDLIEIPKSVADATPGGWKRLKSFLTTTTDDKHDVVPTLVRGINSQLQDQVLKYTDGRIDLSSSFQKMDAGNYLLKIKPVHSDSEPSPKLGHITFSWDPNKKSPLRVAGISPGLYKIILLEESGKDHDPTGEEALVYIVHENKFQQASSEFQEAESVVEQLSNRMTVDAKRSFLWAALQSISREGD